MPASKIFQGFRALGFSSNHVPLGLRYNLKHKENYVVTCVGKAFHTYNCSKLGIVSVSNSHPEDIDCLAVDAYLVYTSCKNVIRAFSRGREVAHEFRGHESTIHILLPFGNHLISVDVDKNLKIWDVKAEELYNEMLFDKATFEVTSIVHPNTYLNKVLIGSKQGSMQLWNIKSNKLLFTFEGWGKQITVLEQAPAIDVIAIGLADGQIILHNIRFDESLMKFLQEWGPVTTITFRTDGHAIMATGSPLGHIALWDLEKRRLKAQMRDCHSSSVSGMKCLPSEPLMVTSSADNSLKVWIFDQPDGAGRLLRERSGHSAPPTKVRFHDTNGQTILSAGQDSTLRKFSTVHDRHNRSLGRASYDKAKTKKSGLKRDKYMMPPITDFASDPTRQSDWDSIVACHRGIREVTTWSLLKHTMGQHKLEHKRFKENEIEHRDTKALCTTISSCGNFCLVGYNSGHVDCYNIQSGIHRGSLGNDTAHNGPVRGIVIDGLNQQAITGGGDGTIKFWRFKKKELVESVKLDAGVSQLVLHRESSLMAVSLDDFTIVIIDIDTRKIVRNFSGHTNEITDMAFSPDARWLISGSMDSTVRTWDIPTGRLIDCFVLDAAVTSLSMSPTGDFLTTTHIDDLGIYLWSNMTLYSHVDLRPLPLDYEPEMIALPSTSRRRDADSSDDDSGTESDFKDAPEYKSPEQISSELVTLSLLPNSHWANLLSLDVIKQRNKPKEPPKAPKSAPFFLPTIPGLEPKFDIPEKEDENKGKISKIRSDLLSYTEFGKLLAKEMSEKRIPPIISALKEMGPSRIDVEIRSLAPEGGGSIELMRTFLDFIDELLKTNKDFELAQAYLGLFLQIHGDIVSSEDLVMAKAKELVNSQNQAWDNLQTMFNQSLCLINYLKSATI